MQASAGIGSLTSRYRYYACPLSRRRLEDEVGTV